MTIREIINKLESEKKKLQEENMSLKETVNRLIKEKKEFETELDSLKMLLNKEESKPEEKLEEPVEVVEVDVKLNKSIDSITQTVTIPEDGEFKLADETETPAPKPKRPRKKKVETDIEEVVVD